MGNALLFIGLLFAVGIVILALKGSWLLLREVGRRIKDWLHPGERKEWRKS